MKKQLTYFNIWILKVLIIFVFLAFITSSQGLAANVVYTYDNNGRMISAEYDDGTAIFYSYDAAGNRLTKEVISENHCNNADRDTDGDVDGSDLAAYISNSMGISLGDLAEYFGRTDCQ